MILKIKLMTVNNYTNYLLKFIKDVRLILQILSPAIRESYIVQTFITPVNQTMFSRQCCTHTQNIR